MARTIAGWTPLNLHSPSVNGCQLRAIIKLEGNFSQDCILTFRMSAGPEKVDPTKPANPPATNFT
jgi:hypothetical protein